MVRKMRRTASVPARINIIGEHTDLLGGMALSFPSQHRLVLSASTSSCGVSGDPIVARLWEASEAAVGTDFVFLSDVRDGDTSTPQKRSSVPRVASRAFSPLWD